MLRRDSLAAARHNAAGLALVEQERWSEAAECFRQALAADAFCGPAHANLGVVLIQLQQYFQAGWELRHACSLMPRAAAPRANLGILYSAVGRYGPAEDELRRALELAPDDLEVIGQLAWVRVQQGDQSAQTLVWLEQLSASDDDPAWRRWARQQLIHTASIATQQEQRR